MKYSLAILTRPHKVKAGKVRNNLVTLPYHL